MKLKTTLLCLALFSTGLSAQTINNKSSYEDKVGYSFGYIMGRSNAEVLKDMNLDAFLAGLKIASQGQNSALTDEEMSQVLTQFKKNAEAKQLKALQDIAKNNAKNGEAFLAENAKKPNVKVTKSGLQYEVIRQGTGKTPKASSQVKVNYEGRLLDNTIFDSSIARQQPAEFNVNQVIAGWTEGLQLMKEGSVYRFYIPAKLAYGEIGSGDTIEPNSTLIFDVELLKVQP